MLRFQQYFIYTLTNEADGNIFYVGSTIQPACRKRTHFDGSSNTAEYIRENNISFRFEIIDDIWTRGNVGVRELETYWISQMKTWGFSIINKYLSTDRYEPKKRTSPRFKTA